MDSHQIYSFAALVIPVLLFGGAVSDAWRPAKETPKETVRKLAVVVWLVMVFAIVAEVTAINATFTERPHEWERIVVVLAVVAGTVAAAGAVAWVWLKYFDELRAGKRIKGTLIAVGVAVGFAGFGLMLATTSVRVSDTETAKLKQALTRLASAEDHSADRLAEIAKRSNGTQLAVNETLRSLSAEIARARAEAALLVRTVERRRSR